MAGLLPGEGEPPRAAFAIPFQIVSPFSPPGLRILSPMTSRKSKKKTCRLCGAAVTGQATLCAACSGVPAGGSAARRVAEKVRDRIQGGEETGGFICPYCRKELSWETIRTSEVEVTIYVREKIYYCPDCRAFLGVSSWHTEG